MPKTKKDIDNEKQRKYSKKQTDDAGKICKKCKTTVLKESLKEDKEEILWPLGKNRYVKVHEFMGSVRVDIRCYYLKDKDIHPGKAGISLAMEQWDEFMKCVDEINERAKAMNKK